MSPTCWLDVAVIFSAPSTSAMRPRPLSMKSSAVWRAAEPVAQAFSVRMAGTYSRPGTAVPTNPASNPCLEKPLFITPTAANSTSPGATPAWSSAAVPTSENRLSTSGASSLPKGEWAHPTMAALDVMEPSSVRREPVAMHGPSASKLPRSGYRAPRPTAIAHRRSGTSTLLDRAAGGSAAAFRARFTVSSSAPASLPGGCRQGA